MAVAIAITQQRINHDDFILIKHWNKSITLQPFIPGPLATHRNEETFLQDLEEMFLVVFYTWQPIKQTQILNYIMVCSKPDDINDLLNSVSVSWSILPLELNYSCLTSDIESSVIEIILFSESYPEIKLHRSHAIDLITFFRWMNGFPRR